MCNGFDPHARCLIPPHPRARARLHEQMNVARASAPDAGPWLRVGRPDRPGLNDGIILPGNRFTAGTPLQTVRSAALDRAPLRGELRVVVVLVDFADRPMDPARGPAHFDQLFFSRGALPNGSVREYFAEVSGGAIDVTGSVVGPYRLPMTAAAYANGGYGIGDAAPNARTMARHAAEAANREVDFKPFDNDGNDFVDAFIVVHAGSGAEFTLSRDDIWSHKWVLADGEMNADGTRIYAYLTVPEDARIGVCCHELGHLLFGWPDLYDIDGSSEGLGDWCLMAGGSWNGDGDIPAHPSAWCKAQQGWVRVENRTANGALAIPDVKEGRTVVRLWKDGAPGHEYFLVENRQKTRYDRLLPGDGLLVYHVDDSVLTNADERHPRVALVQADGLRQLAVKPGGNQGDAGDPFPGSSGRSELTDTTTPGTRSYNNVSTGVSLTGISASGPVMTANFTVRAAEPAGPPAGAAAVPETVRDLVRELAAAVLGPAPGDEAWRAGVEARLFAVERATGGGKGRLSPGALTIADGPTV